MQGTSRGVRKRYYLNVRMIYEEIMENLTGIVLRYISIRMDRRVDLKKDNRVNIIPNQDEILYRSATIIFGIIFVVDVAFIARRRVKIGGNNGNTIIY